MMMDNAKEEFIQFLLEKSVLSLTAAADMMVEEMQNKKILEQHPYKISQYADGTWRTYVPDATKKAGRRQIAKHTREDVEQAIIADYKQTHGPTNPTLAQIYPHWLRWRRDTGTEPKTIEENSNEWKRFVALTPFANKRIKSIRPVDLEDFFLSITKQHAITYRRFSNVKGVLRSIFRYAIRQGILEVNPLDKLDFSDFKRRCKAEGYKENYTMEERAMILAYLEDKTDIYSLAIQLSFYLCLRVGELLAIMRDDLRDDSIFIRHSQHKIRTLNDDLTFNPVKYEVTDQIKGYQKSGYREFPLTPKAQAIVEKILTLYPDCVFLFERNGKPLTTNTFNAHLKRACNALGLPYRSSHQIRFTVATWLASMGVPIPEISTMLGHSNTATTYRYIKQQKVSKKTTERLADLLD